MRKSLVSLMFLFLALILSAPLAWAEPDIRPGMWSGGYGTLEGEAPQWHTMIFDLELDGTKIHGPIRPEGKAEGHIEGDGIVLNIRQDGRRVRCDARLQSGVLLGTCEGGDAPFQLQLVHEEEPSEEVKDELAAIFATETGGRIAIRKSIHLILTDFETGAVRVLYADGPDEFYAGERLGMPHPVALRVRFERDGDGAVSGMVVQDVAAKTTRRASACCLHESEEFKFVNNDITLAGTLYLPSGEGPHPAVVYVHGSGRQTREGAGTWPLFLVDRGFAVLAYDKRGQGDSGGRYPLPGGGHDNQPHMKRRSTDVLAAVRAVKKRADIDGTQVGLMGGSQAGWVMPMVAETGEVAFTVTLSGGATELSLEGKFSNWAQEDGSGGDSIDEMLVRLRRHKPNDYDFRPHFRAQKAPGLWLYGGLDRSNPSALCIELIEEIREENGNDFTVAFFPQGNHGLWQARVGGAAENGALGSMVPGLHRTIGDWLDEKGFGPRGRAASQASAQLSRAVLADPGRPGNEREQDEARKPLELYDWLGIRPGMAVADMWPGGGYNAHLLSLLLGEQGRVVAVWDWYGTDVFGPDYNKRPEFQARVDKLGLANMTMAAEFSDVPDNSIDVALTVRNYHDLWMVEDWKPLSFVREIYRFVKPGGVVGVVEVATPHEGFHKETHRLNEQTVVDHFTSVGFELAGRSNMLANPDDDHTTQGFPNRHLADQYVLKFRKPVSEDLTVAKDGNLSTTQ